MKGFLIAAAVIVVLVLAFNAGVSVGEYKGCRAGIWEALVFELNDKQEFQNLENHFDLLVSRCEMKPGAHKRIERSISFDSSNPNPATSQKYSKEELAEFQKQYFFKGEKK